MKIKVNLIIALAIVFLILSDTIAYSAATVAMTTKGMASTRFSKDIRITDFRIQEVSNNTVSNYEEFNKDTLKTSVKLPSSNSYIKYKVSVTNYDNILQGIYSITNLPSNLNYTLTDYKLGDGISGTKTFYLTINYKNYNSSNILNNIELKFTYRKFHTIKYKNMAYNNYPTHIMHGMNLVVKLDKNPPSAIKISIKGLEIDRNLFTYSNNVITYNNVCDDITISKYELITVAHGSGNNIGDQIKIDSEYFYVTKADTNYIYLLAKNNLYVGGSLYRRTFTPYGPEATNMQDPRMNGFNSFGKPTEGVTQFSTTEFMGTNYTTYQGSIVEKFVNNYKKKLEDLGAEILEARLIRKEELDALGCDKAKLTCNKAPKWVYDNTYWVETATTATDVYRVDRSGYYGTDNYKIRRGVRPFIKIRNQNFGTGDLVRILSGTGENVGDEIAIKDEEFHVISTTPTTITMLAKYNLYLGGDFVYENKTWVYHPYGNEVTYLQDYQMRGYVSTGSPYKGVTVFSDDTTKGTEYSDFKGSIVEKHLNTYKTKLETFGVKINESRLIRKQELIDLGCVAENKSCLRAPSWVYYTSYWVEDKASPTELYSIYNSGGIVINVYDYPNRGVRPVITIDKTVLTN